MKRILAIDFGTKKCGFAISDLLQVISQPLKMFRYETLSDLINEVKTIVNENSPIEKIIIGLPKNIDGTISNTGNRVISFKNILNKEIQHIETILFDEKYSSKSADETMNFLKYSNKKKKESRDILAAQNILENYLLFKNKK